MAPKTTQQWIVEGKSGFDALKLTKDVEIPKLGVRSPVWLMAVLDAVSPGDPIQSFIMAEGLCRWQSRLFRCFDSC